MNGVDHFSKDILHLNSVLLEINAWQGQFIDLAADLEDMNHLWTGHSTCLKRDHLFISMVVPQVNMTFARDQHEVRSQWLFFLTNLITLYHCVPDENDLLRQVELSFFLLILQTLHVVNFDDWVVGFRGELGVDRCIHVIHVENAVTTILAILAILLNNEILVLKELFLSLVLELFTKAL